MSELRNRWAGRWPEALALWSQFTRLSEPRWCFNHKEAAKEGMENSFAMIRLTDHAVVLNLAEISRRKVENFPLEIMGHEIGHHVFCPGDITDHGRMLARIRSALADFKDKAPLIANLYSDLLINDRLQRSCKLNMAGVYLQLKGEGNGLVWALYMRIYEILWGLPKGQLAGLPIRPDMEEDGRLGASLIRVYAREWLAGAGRFAILFNGYLLEDAVTQTCQGEMPWQDTRSIGAGGEPFGLTEVEEEESSGALHPRDDPNLNGEADKADPATKPTGQEKNAKGGNKTYATQREPGEYGALLRDLGQDLSNHQVAMRYYRERARPHLIPFPVIENPRAVEPLPESLEVWQVGEPLEEVDWLESVVRNPTVIPGVTTVQRTMGEVKGFDPGRQVVNLYVGIDCSGSMPNPQRLLSYPVWAGTIVSLSALRAGASVMACLSGEPGSSVATDGFTRSEEEIMELLCGYLGTGYSYGILRLNDMMARLQPTMAPTHLLILSDTDLFSSLDEKKGRGWQVAEQALAKAKGGGTVVLHMPANYSGFDKQVQQLISQGWQVHKLSDWHELLRFAKSFSQLRYGQQRRRG